MRNQQSLSKNARSPAGPTAPCAEKARWNGKRERYLIQERSCLPFQRAVNAGVAGVGPAKLNAFERQQSTSWFLPFLSFLLFRSWHSSRRHIRVRGARVALRVFIPQEVRVRAIRNTGKCAGFPHP